MTVFQDADGTGWLVYHWTTVGDTVLDGIVVSKLRPDMQNTTGIAGDRTTVFGQTGHEAPFMFKRNGVYFRRIRPELS